MPDERTRETEPIRSEPTRDEPTRDEPTRDEPTRDEPTRDEPDDRDLDRLAIIENSVSVLTRVGGALERGLPQDVSIRAGRVVSGHARIIGAVLPDDTPVDPPVEPPTDPDPPVDPDPPIDPPVPPGPPPPPPGGPAFEGHPFIQGGAYDWLPDSYDLDVFKGSILDSDLEVRGEAMLLDVPGMQSTTVYDLTGSVLDNNKHLCTSAFSTSTNQHGPKWWQRYLNASGHIKNILVWRAGDFVKGREGHVLYLNVAADLTIEELTAIQCGAQAIQLVWRDGSHGHSDETGLPDSQHPKSISGNRIVLKNITVIDPGVINMGNAVRASHPLSIFNPGHDELHVVGYVLRCAHPQPFSDNSGNGQFRSHGALLTGSSAWNFKLAELSGLDIVCDAPDRPMIRAHGVDNFRILEGQMEVTSGKNQIDVWTSCTTFEIMPQFDWSGQVKITNHKDFSTSFMNHTAGSHTVLNF